MSATVIRQLQQSLVACHHRIFISLHFELNSFACWISHKMLFRIWAFRRWKNDSVLLRQYSLSVCLSHSSSFYAHCIERGREKSVWHVLIKYGILHFSLFSIQKPFQLFFYHSFWCRRFYFFLFIVAYHHRSALGPMVQQFSTLLFACIDKKRESKLQWKKKKTYWAQRNAQKKENSYSYLFVAFERASVVHVCTCTH